MPTTFQSVRSSLLSFALGMIALAACSTPAKAVIAACTGSALNAAPASGAAGCGTVDIAFNTFADTGTGGLSDVVINALTGGTKNGANTTITPILATFADAGSNWAVGSGNGGVQSQFSTVLRVVSGEAPPASPFVTWGITGLTLTLDEGVTQNTTTTGNFVRVLMEACLGATSFNCTSASANYISVQATIAFASGAQSGTTAYSFTCPALTCTATATGVDFLNYYTNIGINNTVTVTRVTGSSNPTIDLNSFTVGVNQLAYTPEPSTFGMLGAALGALGILARRRRRA